MSILLCCSPALYAWDAKLPRLNDVPALESTAVDGIWRLAINNARIRIEAGRAYALDPWVYLLLWQVKPQMVVLRNFRELQAGRFAADDLLLAGPGTLRLVNADELRANVKGALGPVSYQLDLVEAADMDALQRLWGSLSIDSPEIPEYEPPPSADTPVTPQPEDPVFVPEDAVPNCENTVTDPDSGLTICL